MKRGAITFLMSFSLILTFGQFKPKGTFIGLEEIKNLSDPSRPNYKWYHLCTLTFKGDSVFLEQSPIAIYKKDTMFSASDGGFYSYAGTIGNYEGKPFLDLQLKSCDYCPIQFMKFTPPKIIKDEDTTQISPNDTAVIKDLTIEYPNIKYKIMTLQKTRSNDSIIVDKNVYTRKK